MADDVTVRSISYLVLRCADLDRSRQFYEGLGLRLNAEQHGKGSRHYSCTVGGTVLELYPFSERVTSGLRIGLVVADLDRVAESLRARGIVVTQSADGISVVDPDGHQIALERERNGG